MFCKKSWVGGCVAEFIYAEGYSAEHTRQLISIADNDDTIQNISYDEEGNIDELIFISIRHTHVPVMKALIQPMFYF